jgi:hypothetical protein
VREAVNRSFGNGWGVPGKFLAASVLGHTDVGFIHVAGVIFQISSCSGFTLFNLQADAHAASSFAARALDHHS